MRNLWKNDGVQFVRLLSEIRGTGLTRTQIRALCDSMCLTPPDIEELFERAETAWQEHKARLFGLVGGRS